MIATETDTGVSPEAWDELQAASTASRRVSATRKPLENPADGPHA